MWPLDVASWGDEQIICTHCIQGIYIASHEYILLTCIFRKISILLKTFEFSFYYGENLLQTGFEDMEEVQTSIESTLLQER